MTTPEWKEGDEVRLKSGGPVMTVAEISEYGVVHCRWNGDQRTFTASAAPSALEYAETNRSPKMHTTREWKCGEKCRLNSGGPEMTVIGMDKVGLVLCRWKTPNNNTAKHSFPAVCLKAA